MIQEKKKNKMLMLEIGNRNLQSLLIRVFFIGFHH